MSALPRYSSTFSGKSARIWRVGRGLQCNFKYISDAIAASEPHDRIEIESGDYYETISISHPLELASANDDDMPCINARGPCITVNEDGMVLIENLKVLAKGSKPSDSMAILVIHGKPTIRGCELSSVQVLNQSSPTVAHCKIMRADRGCGLVIADSASGEYMHNDIAFHPEECVRIQSTGQPNLHHNRILQSDQCRALVMITGGKFAGSCQPFFCDNIISGNGEVNLERSPDTAIVLPPSDLTAPSILSAECLVHVSWGAKPIMKGNFACNGVHGFLFGGTIMPAANFTDNRIANCTGWAVAVAEGTGLSMHNCRVQQCGGALRVFNSFANHFGGIPIAPPKSIEVVSHAAALRYHTRVSVSHAASAPALSPTTGRHVLRDAETRGANAAADAMSGFRKEIIAALKLEQSNALRYTQFAQSHRSSAASTSVTQRLRKSVSFRFAQSANRGDDDSSDDDQVSGMLLMSPAGQRRSAQRASFAKEEPPAPATTAAADVAEPDPKAAAARSDDSLTIAVTQCVFQRNFHFGVYIENSVVHLNHCRFLENMTALVFSKDCSFCEVGDNTFEGNVYAAILCVNRAGAVIMRNTITGGGTSHTRAYLTGNGSIKLPGAAVAASASASVGKTTSVAVVKVGERVRLIKPTLAPTDAAGASTGSGPAAPASTTMTSIYGIAIMGRSHVTIRENTISTHAKNIAVMESSSAYTAANWLLEATGNHVCVTDHSAVQLVDNFINSSGRAAVSFSHEGTGILSKNHIQGSACEGVLADRRSVVELTDNELQSCGEALSSRGGSSVHAHKSAITMCTVGAAVRGDRSDMVITNCHVLAAGKHFVLATEGACSMTTRATRFDGCIGTGFHLADTSLVNVEKCQVIDCHDGGIEVVDGSADATPSSPGGSLEVVRSKLMGSCGFGVRVCSSAGSAFFFAMRKCATLSCVAAALQLGPNVEATVTDNKFTGCLGATIDAECRGVITSNTIDGWHDNEREHGLIGVRLAGNLCTVRVADNTVSGCVVGLAVEAGARPAISRNIITRATDAGIIVTGAAPDAVIVDNEVEDCAGVGILIRDGADARFERCHVRDALVASVVVGHGAKSAGRHQDDAAPALFTDCVFTGEGCEILADAEYRLPIERHATRARAVNGLLCLQVEPRERGDGAKPRSSRGAALNKPVKPPGAAEDGSGARQPTRADRRMSRPVALSLRRSAVVLKDCTVGGDLTKQCLVAVHGSISLKGCRLQAPCAPPSPSGAEPFRRPPARSNQRSVASFTSSPPHRQHSKPRAAATATGDHPEISERPAPLTAHQLQELLHSRGEEILANLPAGLGVLALGPDASVSLAQSAIDQCGTAGVLAESSAACTLEECLVTGCAVGIECAGSSPTHRLAEPAAAPSDSGRGTRLTRVTVRHCTTAGLRCNDHGECLLEESNVEECHDGLVLERDSRITCVTTTLLNCARHGVRIAGAPRADTLLDGVFITGCGGFGVCSQAPNGGADCRSTSSTSRMSGVSAVRPSSSLTAGTVSLRPPTPTLKNCEIRSCARGSACVTAPLSFVECSFHAKLPSANDSFDAASPAAVRGRPAADGHLLCCLTTVFCLGPHADPIFTRCHFTASDTTVSLLAVGEGAAAALVECALDGAAAAGGQCVGVAAMSHSRLTMHTCGLQNLSFGALVTPGSAQLARVMETAGTGSISGSGSPNRHSKAAARKSARSAAAAGDVPTPSGSSAGLLSSPPGEPVVAEVHLEQCKFDCTRGAALAGQAEPLALWADGDAPPAGGSLCYAAGHKAPYRLRCVQCTFSSGGGSATPAMVTLGALCKEAFFDACVFSQATCGALSLAADLGHYTAAVTVNGCTFDGNRSGIEVLANYTVAISDCSFTHQNFHDVLLRGGRAVTVAGNRFDSSAAAADGCISVQPSIDGAVFSLRRFAGDRWRADTANAQRDLVRLWAAREVQASQREPREWVFERNTFTDCKSAVCVTAPEASVPAACLPSVVYISHSTVARCGTGVTCQDLDSVQSDSEAATAADIPTDAMRTALVGVLADKARFPVHVLLNTFRGGKTGVAAASRAVSANIWRNTFDGNRTCGVHVSPGCAPLVSENVFMHHDGRGPTVTGDIADMGPVTLELNDEAFRGNIDPFAAVCVASGGSGQISGNTFRDNVLGASFTDPCEALVSDNVFVGNERGIRIAASDTNAGGCAVLPGSFALQVVNNTFVEGGVCDLHASAFTAVPGAPVERGGVLVAYNRFASPGVPASVFIHNFHQESTNYRGTFHLHGNVFTANPQSAVRVARCTALRVRLTSNLLFSVGYGVVIGPDTRDVLLADGVFTQHSAAAVSVESGSSLAAHNCWFACYPDHVTAMFSGCLDASLVDCHFYSPFRIAGRSDPYVVFTAQCKKALVARCQFIGAQPAVMVEAWCEATLTQSLFKGNETGLTARHGAQVHVDATCHFTLNRFSGVRVMAASRGDITLVASNDDSDNTVLSMGPHEVEIVKLSKAVPAVFSPIPFSADMRTITMPELEEQLLGLFVTSALGQERLPDWVLAAPEADTGDDAAVDAPADGKSAAPRAALSTPAAHAARESDALAALFHKYQHLTALPPPLPTPEPQQSIDDGEASTPVAKKASVLPVAKKSAGNEKQRGRAKAATVNPSTVVLKSVERDAEAATTSGRTAARVLEPSARPTRLRDDLVSWAEQHGAALSERADGTPVPLAPAPTMVDVVDSIVSLVAGRSEARRKRRALTHTGASASPVCGARQPKGSVLLHGSTSQGQSQKHSFSPLLLPQGAFDRSVTSAFVTGLPGEGPAPSSGRAVDVTHERQAWNPSFGHQHDHSDAASPRFPADSAEADVANDASLSPPRRAWSAAGSPSNSVNRQRRLERARLTRAKRVDAFPIASVELTYTVCPFERMAPPSKSLAAFALERRREARARRQRQRAERGSVLSDDTDTCIPDVLEETENLGPAITALVPFHKQEFGVLASVFGFPIAYSEYRLYDEETAEPTAPPVLRAGELQEPQFAEEPVLRPAQATPSRTDGSTSLVVSDLPHSSCCASTPLPVPTPEWKPNAAAVLPTRCSSDSTPATFERRPTGLAATDSVAAGARDSLLAAASAARTASKRRSGSTVSAAEGLTASEQQNDARQSPAGGSGTDPDLGGIAKQSNKARGSGTVTGSRRSSSKKAKKLKQKGTGGRDETTAEPGDATCPSPGAGGFSEAGAASPHAPSCPTLPTTSSGAPPLSLFEVRLVASEASPERGNGSRDSDRGSTPHLHSVQTPVSFTGSPRGDHSEGRLGSGASQGRPGSSMTQPHADGLPQHSGANRSGGGSGEGYRQTSLLRSSADGQDGGLGSALRGGRGSGDSAAANWSQLDAATYAHAHSSVSSMPSSARPPRWRDSAVDTSAGDSTADGAGSGDGSPTGDGSDRPRGGRRLRAKSRRQAGGTGTGGLPVTTASSLRPPRGRRARRKGSAGDSSAEESSADCVDDAAPEAEPGGLGSDLTAAPELHTDESLGVWDAIHALVCREDPVFVKSTDEGHRVQSAHSNDSRRPGSVPSARENSSAVSLLRDDQPNSPTQEQVNQAEEADDILALLRWLVERRQFMQPTTFEYAMERLMEGTQHVRPFATDGMHPALALSRGSSAGSVVYDAFVAPGRSRTVQLMPAHKEDNDGADRSVVYLPLTYDAGPRRAAGTDGGELVPCLQVRMARGRSTIEVSVVHLTLDDIPHPSDSFHQPRSAMVANLAATHPDLFRHVRAIFQSPGRSGEDARPLSVTSTLLAAGLASKAAQRSPGSAPDRSDSRPPSRTAVSLGGAGALPPLPTPHIIVANPFTVPTAPPGALSFSDLQKRLAGQHEGRSGRRASSPEGSIPGGAATVPMGRPMASRKPAAAGLHSGKVHRVQALGGAARPRRASTDFDPGKPAATTPFNLAVENPYAFSSAFLATY